MLFTLVSEGSSFGGDKPRAHSAPSRTKLKDQLGSTLERNCTCVHTGMSPQPKKDDCHVPCSQSVPELRHHRQERRTGVVLAQNFAPTPTAMYRGRARHRLTSFLVGPVRNHSPMILSIGYLVFANSAAKLTQLVWSKWASMRVR